MLSISPLKSLPVDLGNLGIRSAIDSTKDAYVSAPYEFNYLAHRYDQ